VGTYSSIDQLLNNGLLATSVLSLFMLIPVAVVLALNFLRKSGNPTVLQIIGSVILVGIITVGISIFSVHVLASIIKIAGGIKVNFSDLEPLGFIIMVAFYSSLLSLILLILGKVLHGRKYLLLIVIGLLILIAGYWKIHQNAVAMESRYVLEQCQTLAYNVVRESGLTQIGQDLGALNLKSDKVKMNEILADYGPRCKKRAYEAFGMFREWLLSLSLSKKTNFESNFKIEQDNFINWINQNEP